jgi:2-furoyl-CoA dehydrogenase large subunit
VPTGGAPHEKFSHNHDGQLLRGTFMGYPLPSAMEIPDIRIVDHCTPSPLTTFDQKGSGEAGYVGAPAGVANAINDALAPLGVSINTLPLAQDAIWRTVQAAQTTKT